MQTKKNLFHKHTFTSADEDDPPVSIASKLKKKLEANQKTGEVPLKLPLKSHVKANCLKNLLLLGGPLQMLLMMIF